MRLAQLARKLAIRPTVIVEFLTKHNIQIEDGSNTRLEDDHVILIMQKFAPAMAAEVAVELAVEKEVEAAPIAKELALVITQPEVVERKVELPLPIIESQPEEIELIKAPKVELSGLKVLGKIELPEPKKKEIEPVSDTVSTTDIIPTEVEIEKKPRQENRKPYPARKEIDTRPRTNPIALQRERETLEKETKKRANVEREKEKRTQHYLNKVKTVAPTKSLKLVKEEVEEMTPLAPVPKTIWGKFKKWLNT